MTHFLKYYFIWILLQKQRRLYNGGGAWGRVVEQPQNNQFCKVLVKIVSNLKLLLKQTMSWFLNISVTGHSRLNQDALKNEVCRLVKIS